METMERREAALEAKSNRQSFTFKVNQMAQELVWLQLLGQQLIFKKLQLQ